MFRKFCARAAGLAALLACASAALAEPFTGAGASFPAPLYQAWAQQYKALTGDELNYQAIGSGGGIRQISAGTVDFGASDKPLQPADLARAGLVQFPTVVGGVVPIVHLPGVAPGQLRLTGALLGEIFLGHVKRWNDPRLTQVNPGLRLPPLPITVVHRSDGAGTTFIFTSYLSQVSAGWAHGVGASDSVRWPTGIGGKGNDGVNAYVKQTFGAIGYVEFAYARRGGVAYTVLQNASGRFIRPEAAAFAAAARAAPWGRAPGNYLLLVNQRDPAAWPISGATFILLRRQPTSARKQASVLKFFDWAYARGDATAARLDFVPLPAPVKDLMRRQWKALGGRAAG